MLQKDSDAACTAPQLLGQLFNWLGGGGGEPARVSSNRNHVPARPYQWLRVHSVISENKRHHRFFAAFPQDQSVMASVTSIE